jgi:two-component system, NarL family, nitrate/nitrite response regulator NarL
LLFRESLAVVLEAQPDIRVPAHVSSVTEAVRMMSLIAPIHCAVIEFEPGSIESFCDDLINLRQSTPILLIADVMNLRELQAIRPIVAGILLNSSNSGALIEAIRAISAGRTWEDLPHLDGSEALLHTRHTPIFTPRQQMVLQLICDGLSNKECAHAMNVSQSSVKCTIQQLFAKTKAGSRSQLVRYAFENLRTDSSQRLSRA